MEKERQVQQGTSIAAAVQKEKPFGRLAIGLGLVAMVCIFFVLIASWGGGKPDFPSTEDLVGRWDAIGTRKDGNASYTGIYTLTAKDGLSTYDIVGRDGSTKSGNGTWEHPQETLALVIRNDTGSIYKGEFAQKDFTTVSMITTDGRWHLVLKKLP
jgi:hypothetical protein